MRHLRLLTTLLTYGAGVWLHAADAATFPLVAAGRPAVLVVAPTDARVVTLAAHDLAHDIARVTDTAPTVVTVPPEGDVPRVLIGTLGQNPALDALVASRALDVSGLRGAWESFLIATLAPPAVSAPTLVIAGSDRRGTAFGVYEVSQQIGVSPWHWWADVEPEKRATLTLPAGLRRFGPPAVKYRGIFLNDEDWGLQPWAAEVFEPENGGIGRKTYARVFELLLRLRANTLWPAMHACTKPFNADPAHAQLADDYAIVMGSSHAEPMLRNNVGEWPAGRAADYNYITNRAGVRAYWEERVRTNGRFENLYTLGMRGIHDSAIQGARSDAERIAVLTQVFADQRALLAAHARPPPAPATERPAVTPDGAAITSVPQIFCAYKEVLDLYRQGLAVPDDVTLVWPDDNFGYVRQFASPREQQRLGRAGVYYHLSYLGRPLAYLWLSTMPPALVWAEMTRSFAHGADRVWIANVGDLKPAERDLEFFLQLAWDPSAWKEDAQPKFLHAWATREFGPELAPSLAALLTEYYRLNFARKPEHLQWWRPDRRNDPTNRPPDASRYSDFTDAEIDTRLAGFDRLVAEVERMRPLVPPARADAYFQLVVYPVVGSALANRRYFHGERGHLALAHAADADLRALTAGYDALRGGKWRGFLRLEPATDEWKSMRIAPWAPPESPRPPRPAPSGQIAVQASEFIAAEAARTVAGLGRTGAALRLPPGATVTYEIELSAGTFELSLELLPTHPTAGDTHQITLQVDGGAPLPLALPIADGGLDWAEGVLAGYRPLKTRLLLDRGGRHRFTLTGVSDGLFLDRLVLQPVAP